VGGWMMVGKWDLVQAKKKGKLPITIITRAGVVEKERRRNSDRR